MKKHPAIASTDSEKAAYYERYYQKLQDLHNVAETEIDRAKARAEIAKVLAERNKYITQTSEYDLGTTERSSEDATKAGNKEAARKATTFDKDIGEIKL